MSYSFPNRIFMPNLNINRGIAYGGGGGAAAPPPPVQTVTAAETGVPSWARPYVEDSLGSAVDLYKSGAMSHVQGFNPEQVAAMERKKQLGGSGGVYDQIALDSYQGTQAYRDAAGGTGMFGANALGEQAEAMKGSIGNAVTDVLGQQRGGYSRSGNLGGARAQASQDQSAMRIGGEMAAAELNNRRQAAMSGAGGVLNAGRGLQNQFGAGASMVGDVGSSIQQQNQNEGDAAYQGIQRMFGLYGSPAIGSVSNQTSTQSGGQSSGGK